MNRRDLLKAIPAIATLTDRLHGKQQAKFFEIPPDRKVIAFVNVDAMPLEQFAKIKLPAEVTICPISVPEGQKIDDVIRIYDLARTSLTSCNLRTRHDEDNGTTR